MFLFVCLFSPPAQELLISDASSCLSWPFRFPAGITWGTKVTQDHPDRPFAHQWLLRSGLGYQQVLGGSVWAAYAPRASCRALLVTLGLEKNDHLRSQLEVSHGSEPPACPHAASSGVWAPSVCPPAGQCRAVRPFLVQMTLITCLRIFPINL